MATKSQRHPRRTDALSRDVIVEAATEILDAEGEDALTLRALTVRLATGYGAIYHHVADRDDLLAAATDHVIARVVTALVPDAEPRPALRVLALGLFDAIVAHPWVGTQLNRGPWRPALLDIYESISAHLQALDVPQRAVPDSAGVLVNYILGVAGQNAANARALASSKMDRSAFLAGVAEHWAQLDPAQYPSVHRAGAHLREHDDREQFLAGVDLILAGIETVNRARIEQLAIIVDDYDQAIGFFVSALGFDLVEDSPALTNDGRPKRWVVVRPPGAQTGILLARADGSQQTAAIGNQMAGRVGFFFRVRDFDAAYASMTAAGVHFLTAPRAEPYGRVAVFLDVAGNKWDLLGPAT